MPRTITIASQKGGVGKTTTAVNLAATLGLAGHEVLLIDLCPQANATSGVGLAPEDGATHGCLRRLLDGARLDPFMQKTEIPRLRAIPSSSEVADLELVQRLIQHPAKKLRRALGQATEDFDYVLIDCPPSLRGPPTIALHVSDSVIIPIQCEYYAMEGLSQILPIIQEVQSGQNKSLRIEGLLLTMFSPELELSQEVVDEICGYFRDTAFRSIVPRDVTLAESASHGLPAIEYAPRSRGAWSYVELAREVMSHG